MAAITLSVNKFIGTITNLVAYQDVNSTLKDGNTSSLMAMVMHENVPNGNGKVLYTVNTLPIDDYAEASSLLSVEKPTIHEQYIAVNNFKKIKLSINEWLLRGAFVREDAMAKLVAYVRTAMQKTKDYFLYSVALDQVNTLFKNTIATSYEYATPAADATAVEKQAIREANANGLFEAIQNELVQFTFPRRHTVGASSFMQAFNPSDFRVLLSYKANAKLNINSLARLFNNAYAIKGIDQGNIIILPSASDTGEIGFDVDQKPTSVSLTGADTSEIADTEVLVIHKDKIQMGYFYEVATAFFDASNLTNHNWLHFSYYLGIADAFPVSRLAPSS